MERELARRAASGDRAARDELVRQCTRLPILHALRLGYSGDALDDAVQDGLVGLLGAVDRFDPDRGVRLSTFAWSWISGAIRRGAGSAEGRAILGEEVTAAQPRTSAELGLLEGLPADCAAVLRLRFGFDAEPAPRREVAARLGLTVSQVRTLEWRGMELIRARIREPFSHPAR